MLAVLQMEGQTRGRRHPIGRGGNFLRFATSAVPQIEPVMLQVLEGKDFRFLFQGEVAIVFTECVSGR